MVIHLCMTNITIDFQSRLVLFFESNNKVNDTRIGHRKSCYITPTLEPTTINLIFVLTVLNSAIL